MNETVNEIEKNDMKEERRVLKEKIKNGIKILDGLEPMDKEKFEMFLAGYSLAYNFGKLAVEGVLPEYDIRKMIADTYIKNGLGKEEVSDFMKRGWRRINKPKYVRLKWYNVYNSGYSIGYSLGVGLAKGVFSSSDEKLTFAKIYQRRHFDLTDADFKEKIMNNIRNIKKTEQK